MATSTAVLPATTPDEIAAVKAAIIAAAAGYLHHDASDTVARINAGIDAAINHLAAQLPTR